MKKWFNPEEWNGRIMMSRTTGLDQMHNPGAFWIRNLDAGQEILIRLPTGLARCPSSKWDWNGNLDAPTLDPSVKHTARYGNETRIWHGHVQDGWLVPCEPIAILIDGGEAQ